MDPDLDSAPPLLPHPTSPSNHLSQVHQLCQHTPLLLRCKTCQIHPLAPTSRPFHLLKAQQRLDQVRGVKGTPFAPVTTMPMVEVAGAQGPMLVFRPWSDTDVAEAMNYICNPKDNLTEWETDLQQFVKEYRPTISEL